MNTFIQHIKQVAKDDLRLYFAPFIGAYDGIKKELNRPDRYTMAHRQETKSKSPP